MLRCSVETEPVRASSLARAEAEACYATVLRKPLLVCCFVVVELIGVAKSVVCHSHVLQLAPGAFRQTTVVLALHIVVHHPLWLVH